jgi:NTP pyrophosphatase (non-canonical NTP hydrolase)
MNITEYQSWVEYTWANTSCSTDSILSVMALGLAGECGEVLEEIEILEAAIIKTTASENLKLELGDVIFYWTRIVSYFEINILDLVELDHSINKNISLDKKILQLYKNISSVSEIAKKQLRDDLFHGKLFASHMRNIYFYWSSICEEHSLAPIDLMIMNMEKVKNRKIN